MHMPLQKIKHPFTLAEFVMATGLMVMMSAVAIGGFVFVLATQKRIEMQSELDMDLRVVVESLKKDVRLSATDKMLFYPSGAGPHSAFSFPKARDDDGDGLIDLDEDGKIIWDETVIYHTYETASGIVLRRTVYNPRDNAMTEDQRYQQLIHVVQNGQGDPTASATVTLVDHPFTWEIDGAAAVFDAYSPEVGRSSNLLLGTALIGAGNHYLEFVAVAKNPSSEGYNLGIDTITMSPSGLAREAEAQKVYSVTGTASHEAAYMPMGNWSGNHEFSFSASAVGNAFVLEMPSDAWTETNFAGSGGFMDQTAAVFDTSLWPADFVVRLDDAPPAWESAAQTGSTAVGVDTGMSGTVIRCIVKGSHIQQSMLNPWIEFTAPAEGKIHIAAAYIAENYSTATTPTSLSGTAVPLAFESATGNSSSLLQPGKSQWATVKSGYDFFLDSSKTYAITFLVGPDNSHGNCRYSQNIDATAVDSYLIPASESPSATTAQLSDWSTFATLAAPKAYVITAVRATYAHTGAFTSRITDTHLEQAKTGTISWNDVIAAGTGISMKVRSGSMKDLSDASDWSTLVPVSSGTEFALGRYVQFRASLTANAECTLTPKLQDVTISWPGEARMADIAATITTAPDHGIYELRVDGWPLIKGITVKLEVHDDIRLAGGGTATLSAKTTAEFKPRNTGF